MRNWNLSKLIYLSSALVTLMRLAIFGVLVWACVEVDDFILRFLLAGLSAVQLVETVRRAIYIVKLMRLANKIGK